jgi:hypothetical protein
MNYLYERAMRKTASDDENGQATAYATEIARQYPDLIFDSDGKVIATMLDPMAESKQKKARGITSYPVTKRTAVKQDSDSGKWSTYETIDLTKKTDDNHHPSRKATKLDNYAASGVARILNFLQSPTATTLSGLGLGAGAGALLYRKNRLLGAGVGGLLGAGAGYGAYRIAKYLNYV